MVRTKTKIHWDNKDPATPALIEPMLDDERDLDRITDPIEKEATTKTIDYCKVRIKFYQDEGMDALTMGEMSGEAQHFYDGFMAARTGEVRQY